MKDFIRAESRLLLALLALLVLMNVPYGRFVLYPFQLFSTWVHEMGHGLAALALGGSIAKVQIFADGSGLAHTARPDARLAHAFVASAGYVGTAVFGALLLALRRVKGVSRAATVALGIAMLLTVLLWVRNPFGMLAIGLSGAALVAVGIKLQDEWNGQLFAFLAATCSLNAITSVQTLFSANMVVNGQSVGRSDAHAVAENLLLPSWAWASLWLVIAFALTALALRFPLGRRAE